MKITVNTKQFKNAVEKASKATAVKPSLPMIENILLESDGENLMMYATNLEHFIKIKVPIISGADKFRHDLDDTKSLLKAVKFFDDDITEITYDLGKMEFKCGGKKASQYVFENEFPEPPKLEDELTNSMGYDLKKLKERFSAIEYSVSQEESRGILCGIYFCESDMVALDGYRLALSRDEHFAPHVPFTILPTVIKLAVESIGENDIDMFTDTKYIMIRGGDTTVWGRLLDGEYPNYKTIIDNKGEIKSEISGKEFLKNLKYLKEASGSLNISWNGNKLGTKKYGKYFECQTGLENFGLEIGFNAKYMIEAISKLGDATAFIGGKFTPIMLEKGENNIALILPIRMGENILEG